MMRIILLLASVLMLCGFSHGGAATPTADPLASQATQNVLIYLQNVGRRASHRVVTGQMFGKASCCTTADNPPNGWTNNIAALYTATGQYPGLVGADYNNMGTAPFVGVDYTALNAELITAWQAGSLIEISWHPMNPWTGQATADPTCNGNTLTDLVTPGGAGYAFWHSQLDSVAAGLQTLQAAGVVVIWRPIMEQNGSGWWFQACNPNYSQSAYAAIWQDMFNYLTTTKGLHNLVWLFASDAWLSLPGCPGVAGESGLCLYPGSAVVDVVGVDIYNDGDNFPEQFQDNWVAWQSLGKVTVIAERGPAEANGTSPMYAGLIPGMVANRKSSIPVGAYFMAWMDAWSIVSNPGASALMNDPNAANQADVKAVMACMNAATTYAARVACALN